MSETGMLSASSFSFVNLMGSLFFGMIGLGVFIYGKKERNFKALLIGITLMVYPYFFANTFWLYGIGVALCLLLYFWRD